MMGAMMKGEQDLLTLQIKCSGEAKGMTVTADSRGNVKGYGIVINSRLLHQFSGGYGKRPYLMLRCRCSYNVICHFPFSLAITVTR